MKKITLVLTGLLFGTFCLNAQVAVKPAHVIFVLEENYGYSNIIGSSYAPTFTALSKASYTANFTAAYAITHPSEPNYLDLYAGNDQGIVSDESGQYAGSLGDCNLGSSLIQAKYTFIGYSEDQPSVGYCSNDVPPYYTKHCPWINWIHGSPDSVPVNSDIPFSYLNGYTKGPIFPDSLNYASLPTVAWVIPNIDNDMHDPSTPSTAISTGDTWFKKNMMPLVRWASNASNNTIVITIWDEDDGCPTCTNNIPLLVSGGIVHGGNYSQTVNHYDVLKTIEDMYGLTECGSSATAVIMPNSMWNITTGINTVSQATTNQVTAWPVPAKNELNMDINSVEPGSAKVAMYDITGRMVKEMPVELKTGDNYLTINTEEVSNGVYFLNVTGEKINLCKKIVVGK